MPLVLTISPVGPNINTAVPPGDTQVVFPRNNATEEVEVQYLQGSTVFTGKGVRTSVPSGYAWTLKESSGPVEGVKNEVGTLAVDEQDLAHLHGLLEAEELRLHQEAMFGEAGAKEAKRLNGQLLRAVSKLKEQVD